MGGKRRQLLRRKSSGLCSAKVDAGEINVDDKPIIAEACDKLREIGSGKEDEDEDEEEEEEEEIEARGLGGKGKGKEKDGKKKAAAEKKKFWAMLCAKVDAGEINVDDKPIIAEACDKLR